MTISSRHHRLHGCRFCFLTAPFRECEKCDAKCRFAGYFVQFVAMRCLFRSYSMHMHASASLHRTESKRIVYCFIFIMHLRWISSPTGTCAKLRCHDRLATVTITLCGFSEEPKSLLFTPLSTALKANNYGSIINGWLDGAILTTEEENRTAGPQPTPENGLKDIFPDNSAPR